MNASLPPIRFTELAAALLLDAKRLVPMWLPDGDLRGHEYVCGSLAGGKGSSCSVNMTTGQWADFATGEQGGDLLSLYATANGLTMGKAAVQVARETGLESVAGLVLAAPAGTVSVPRPPQPPPPPKPTTEQEGWRTVWPVPANAPAPTFKHHYRTPESIEHRAEYRVGDDLHGYVVRFGTSDGGKETLPYTWCASARDGASKWHWRQWDGPRPLFLPGQALPGERTVVLVEGERKAEALQALADAAAPGVYCVASWAGGCKAWKKSDWAWLQRCTVLLWPDCDAKREPLTPAERKATPDKAAQLVLQQAKPIMPAHKQPGMAAMLGIGALLRDAHGCTVQLLPIPTPGTVTDGWDCRDAIEIDGWDFARVLAFFGQAQALPIEGVATDPGAGKKIVPSVGTESCGDAGFAPLDDGDDHGQVKCGDRLVPLWLSYYYDSEKTRWNVSRKTVIAALEKHPALRDVLAFNELSGTVQCRVPGPWARSVAGDVKGRDSLLLGKWMSDTWGLPALSKSALDEGIQTVAYSKAFHPIRDWLSEIKWDGKPRLDRWLMHALGEKRELLKPLMAEYLSLVGRYWMLGMVYRVMEPGCKFDYCPVLEGEGGLRKSTLVKIVASKDYFSDTPFDLSRGKEAYEQVQGRWLYEIAELSSLSRSDVNAIKAFISSEVDRYRVAYGTTTESFPRQCVFVGTTNEDTYLRDRSGNRRWWPVPVRHKIDTDWVQKYRELLFAEAYHLYLDGASYTPTDDQETRLFKPMQESRMVETAVESSLLRLLTRKPFANTTGIDSHVHVDAKYITLEQVVSALGADPAKSSMPLENQIRGWLKQQGWINRKKQINGARGQVFIRPDVWPPQGGSVGLDQEDDDDAMDMQTPVLPSPSGPAAQGVSPAAQFVQDLDPDCVPF